MAIDAFERAMPLINARFQEYGRAATPEDIAGLRSQAESLGLDFSDPNLGFTPQYQSWATAVANAAKPAPVASPLSYLQVGQQLFNRGLAQPEINYLQSLYGQDVDPTEMSALQKALAPNEAIGGLYQSVLGRAPDPFGQMYWSQIFGSEISPEERAAFEQAAAAEIAQNRVAEQQRLAAASGPSPLDTYTSDAARGNATYNGVVYDTVEKADAQRLKDTQEAAGSSSSQAVTEAVAEPPVGGLSSLQQTFTPGQTLTSGFGNVAEQLGGTGYYKGVVIPRFQEIYDTEQGPGKSVAQQLADWKANVDKQDLSANAPFGFVETPIYTQPTGDYDAYVSGYQATPATAFDYLLQSNPVIADAILSHTSTGAYAYKVVNGQLKEVPHSEITPEDITQGNAFFMLAGKTGGPNRERMSQLYRASGDLLIPVGDPKIYQGAKETDMGLAFLDMAASALSFVPGPWQVPAMAYKAIRAAEAGDWSQVAKAFLPAPVATAIDVYEAFDSKDPFRIATALMGTDVLPEVGSFDLGAGVTVKDAVLAAKAVEAINNGQWDVAAIIGGQLSGSSELTAAGQGLRIKNAIDRGDYMGAMTAVQGLSSTINKLTTAPPNLLNEIAFQEANVSPAGLSALSPIPAEDEQIAIQQRVTKANQAIADYAGPGNDLSREGLVSQLQSFGLTADQAEGYAQKADQQINMNRVGADVMNRYSKIDPEFGTPQLDRDTAVRELVTAGYSSDRANEILNNVDAENASKLENRLNVQAAYNDLIKGTGTADQLRSAMMLAGYTDAQINNQVTKGLGILEGSRLTAGEQVQERVSQLPDVRAEIAAKPTFSEAYRLARDTYGSGATFTWQGKSYSTATAEERPDLTGKPTDKTAPENQKSLDLTGATEWELNLMRKPLGFDANNATTARLMSPQEFKSLMSDPKLGIDPSTLDQRYQAYLYSQAPRVNAGQRASLPFELAYRPPSDIYENPPTSFDEFKNTVLGGVAAGSRVASDAQNVINSLTSNLAALAPSIVAGVASSVTGDAENAVSSALRRIADIASSSSDVVVPELALSAQNISNAVSDAQGWGKVGALVNAVADNPGAAMWWIAKEGSEELIPIAAAAKVLQATGSLRAAAMANGILSYIETQGLTQEELIRGFQDLGLTSTQAAQAASPGAFAAGAAESIISPLVDLPVIKLLAKEGSDAGQTLGKRILSIVGSDVKETVGESLQEGAGSVAKQLATTGKVNTNEALTDAVLGGFVGGKTSAGMTTLEALSQPGVLSGAVQESIDKLGSPGVTAITSSVLKASPDPASTGQILLAAQENGVNVNDAVANILQGANTSGIQMPGVFVSLSTALQSTGLTEADANKIVVDAASNISTDLGSLALTATKKPGPVTIPSAGPTTDFGTGPSTLDLQNLLASQGSQTLGGTPTGGSQLPVGGPSVQVPSGPATLIPSGPSTQAPSTPGTPITQIPGGVSTEPAVKSQAQIEAEARAASQADLNSRTYKGQIYPTVEAASEARLADSAPGAQQATRADLEATLKGMGLTPTKEAMDSLLSGNPTNDQLLTRLRSAPDLLASLKPATSGTSASLATETKPEGGPTIVTEGDTTIITETVGDTKSQTQINGNTIKQVNTDLNTGAESTFTSNGNQNSQLIVTDGLTLNVSTDKNANITVSVKDSDDGLVTVVKTQTGGNVSVLNNDGSTSETLVDGNIIVNTNNNTLIKTFLDTKTNTFTVVTGLDETIGGGSVDDLDPVVSDDIFRGLSELSFVQPVPDLQVPAVAVEPPQVTPPKEPEPKKEPPKKPAPQPSGGGGGAGALLTTGASGELGRLLGQMLEAKVTNEKYIDPLANLPKLTQEAPSMNNDPRLERYLDERGPDPDSNYYSYGKVPSLDEILGGQVMAQGGQVMPLPFMYAKGGLSRQDFRQGKHVSGPGDGQSDDIPAMLADGEFVFPADVVAALGNGSTKAGTQKLYEMMHAIRQRARSTKVKDLPPPALKSPLDYLKSRK